MVMPGKILLYILLHNTELLEETWNGMLLDGEYDQSITGVTDITISNVANELINTDDIMHFWHIV